MAAHKYIDRICCVIMVLALLLSLLFMNGESLGISTASSVKAYESRIFDTSRVHTIDIQMDDWDTFIENCANEEYEACSVVIDGETCSNVAIRAKGNTSLTQVENYGNGRYSFKIEFDHYDSANQYYGLDKLSLNNIVQDNTYMKDYLTYQMMAAMGVDAPLCSYVNITVNGESWGLYLAVESVEESFLERNYGSSYGELYKPDSSDMGGGRGNGGAFDMDEWKKEDEASSESDSAASAEDSQDSSAESSRQGETVSPPGGQSPGGQPPGNQNGGDSTSGEEPPELPDSESGENSPPQPPEFSQNENQDSGTDSESADGSAEGTDSSNTDDAAGSRAGSAGPGPSGTGGKGGGVSGSDDVSLIYSDDDYDSYANIFDNAKTEITDDDKDRLIAALKQLNEGENLEDVVDVDEVIRYFAVHNFVCSFDSYTGSMIHNYYLYEEDGQLSMIPWDYNLAFGGFQSQGSAEELVNYPIDTPVSGGTVSSRPMLSWIFENETYTELYHQYLSEFMTTYFDSGYFSEMIDSVEEMIAPYVEADATKFCTYEEFETGVAALKEFCLLRAESVSGQLSGDIPSTSDGQKEDSSALVDASDLQISDMGSMNLQNGSGGFGGGPGERTDSGESSGNPDGAASPGDSGSAESSGSTDSSNSAGGAASPGSAGQADKSSTAEENAAGESSADSA